MALQTDMRRCMGQASAIACRTLLLAVIRATNDGDGIRFWAPCLSECTVNGGMEE
jgi:hypothetical protein